MTKWKQVLVCCLLSTQVFAQEQLALRMNEQGIMKVLRMAIRYNTATKESRTLVIPRNLYKFTLPKEKLLSNPIIPVINEISDLNLKRDLDFYLNTSDIKVSGDVDVKSLKATILNSHSNGFDLRLSLSLPKVTVTAPQLSLCEDKKKGSKTCGQGLKSTLTNLSISTLKRPVTLTVVLRLKTNGGVARVSVISVDSNLEGKSAPQLNINFKAITIPRIAIVIDGQETELDTSRLKDEILKRKDFLASKLLDFAGNFIASDVAEMINVYLVNKEIATTYQVYRRDTSLRFDEFIREKYGLPNFTYVRDRLTIPAGSNPMSAMMTQISEIIRNAQLDIGLKKISTPSNKDVELSGIVNFVLNGRDIRVRDTLGNSKRPLPKLDLSSQRNNDINLAISEPLINGALDLANSTNLFQEVFEAMSPVPGFSIRSVKLHFQGNSALVAVVNAQVDLKKLKATNIKEWFKNKIAAWLEKENNNAVIYFPIEVAVLPYFRAIPGGGTALDLKVLSPFNYRELPNRFNYPTNVPNMTKTVKDGVMEELRESLEPHTNKTYNIDLSKFLNQSGVVFLPKSIAIGQGAYLLLNLDIVDIKFNSKDPSKR